jgi:hypothetical protein
MAYDQKSLDDYVDVATRIADFRAKYPDGYLSPWDPAHPYRIETVTGTDRDGREVTQTFVAYTAAAYRDPSDGNPGIGCAWEIFPGRTPYTRGSELMNAETSAWGRAIVALGASDSKLGIASREEVRNRQAERDQPASASLSDAERDAGGMMTSEQRAEHNALRRQPARRGTTERARDTAADTDAWTDQPAGKLEQTPAETRPETSDRRQWQRLAILYGQAGITSDEDRHADLQNRVPGRVISSAKHLSYAEAQQIIKDLEQLVKGSPDA